MNEHELFAAALEIDAPDERSAYLEGACGGDDALGARVEARLRAHERGFLSEAPDRRCEIVKNPLRDPAPGYALSPGEHDGEPRHDERARSFHRRDGSGRPAERRA